jgi:hypothetical protein
MILTTPSATAGPLSLYSENPHYFLFGGKPTVLVTSGEHYGAVLNCDFDYQRYLETLQAENLNLTRIFSGSYREVAENSTISGNTLAPAAGKFLAPWRQKDGKFDLTKWDDDYFARLKNFVSYADRSGVVVEVVLFCPFYDDCVWNASPMNVRNNVNGIGDIRRMEVLALKSPLIETQDRMVAKVVSELRDFDNIYYEICNEPYLGNVKPSWQEHIAKTIAKAEAGFAKKHLIAQNWANGSSAIKQQNPLVSVFNFHYSRPPAAVGMNWKLGKPIGNNESGFDGGADATYRIQGWDFLMAGGALYNNLDYSFAVGHEDGRFVPPENTPGGGSATLRRQLRHLRAFFDQIPFWRMQPADTRMAHGPEGTSVRVLSEAGKIYAVYMHHGRPVRDARPPYQIDRTAASRQLTLRLPTGHYRATWRDTTSGADVKSESFESGRGVGTTLTSPVYSEDIALVLRVVDQTARAGSTE